MELRSGRDVMPVCIQHVWTPAPPAINAGLIVYPSLASSTTSGGTFTNALEGGAECEVKSK